MMLHTLTLRLIAREEARLGENADWLRELLALSPTAFWKFVLFTPLSRHRMAASPGCWHAARITAVWLEDCGSCLNTVLAMAAADGLPQHWQRQLLEAPASLPDDERLARAFAAAVVANDPALTAIRENLQAMIGEIAVAELAVAIAAARVFPVLKRGLGHGGICALGTMNR